MKKFLDSTLTVKKFLLILSCFCLLGAGTGGVLYCNNILCDTYIDLKVSSAPAVSGTPGARVYVDNASNALQLSVNGQSFNNLPGKMNYIMNGDGFFSQRQGAPNSIFNVGAGVATQDTYGADRWRGSCSSNTMFMCTRYVTSEGPVFKSITTNVASMPLINEDELPTGAHVIISLAPADAIFDGVQTVTTTSNNGVRNTQLNYTITHADVGNTATAGNISEQNLNASSYLTVRSSSTNKMVWYQVIEMHNKPNLRGHVVTTQFKLKGVSSGNTLRSALVQLGSTAGNASDFDKSLPVTLISAYGANGTDPTYSTTSSYHVIANVAATATNGSVVSSQAQFTPNVDWTQCWFTTTLPKNYDNLMLIFWTNNTPANNDWFSVSEVGLYDDSTLQQWQPREQAQELALCQRYYCKSFILGTVPADNVGFVGNFLTATPTGQLYSPAGSVRFPAEMRASPTVTTYNPGAGTTGKWRNYDSNADLATATAIGAQTTSGVHIYTSGTPAAGQPFGIHWTANADY